MKKHVCDRIVDYKGNKSQKILDMVAGLERKRFNKTIPELMKDNILVSLIKKDSAAKVLLETLEKTRKVREEKLNIKPYEYYDSGDAVRGYVAVGCLVPESVEKKLQNASDLHSLGKFEQAKNIWDSVITEYNIGKQ